MLLSAYTVRFEYAYRVVAFQSNFVKGNLNANKT